MPDNLLSPGASGASVSMLHTALQQQGLNVPDSEVKQAAYGTGTKKAVQQFQKANNLPVTGKIDATTASTMASLTNVGAAASAVVGNVNQPPASGGSGGSSGGSGTPSGGGNTPSTVQGKLTFDNGMPASNIPVLVMRVVFGGQDTLLVRTVSDGNGAFQASYTATSSTATAATQNPQPASNSVNLQIRSLDSAGKEVILSATRYNVSTKETFNLIVPASSQVMETEFQRLANDLLVSIGGIANLAAAKESPQAGQQRDLSLLRRTTKWDARLTALAATAVQQSAVTGISQDAMYALLRVGLPSTPELLAQVPVATVEKALNKANQAGVVKLNVDQIQSATTAFKSFASKTQLTLKAPGMVSSIGTLLTTFLPDAAQQEAFTQLFLANPEGGAALWEQAAKLNITAATLDQLKLQGKFLHLTKNNALLASHLQTQIGSINNLPRLADQDYHESATWTNTLNQLATGNKITIDQLIPGSYVGNTTADRLNAYSADMARKVRLSFPTQVTARMIDKNQITLPPAQAGKVSSFLRSATQQGYELGHTPLNQFLARPGSPKIDADGTASLKTLHRLYQVTPSNESLQVALKQGFSSAYDIAANSWEDFKNKYGAAYPSLGEAGLVYRKSQQITTVTFNAFTMAKQMDSAPPVYALSSSSADKQIAKNALIQQFPSMGSMFGSLDFCQCEDCRSVLSPAAYFVDLLEYLRQSTANAAGYTPLDVLIGKDNTVPGRRPDLAALPLTCENTNTALPYIDIVNEILEYSIVNGKLDSGVAYDTGSATSAQLIAEPQHTLPQVYNTVLQQALYPLQLPFDLWLEMVRGFLNYTKTPLADLLTDLCPVDSLELFTDANNYSWYGAQILAESLNISPSEYNLFAVTNAANHKLSVANWFALYGYADENTALNGQPDPINIGSYLIPPCRVAKNLSIRLGLTYQEFSDVVMTGFFNPYLYKLIYQFKRYGISSDDAFSYTNQAGLPVLTAQQKSDFESQLQAITDRYKKTNPASTFDAKTWLVSVLPANYSSHVLVLYDPDTGCNFSGTSLQYADGTAATALDFLKLNLFVRLWKKTGWALDEIDRALQCFFPTVALPVWSDPGFAAAYSQHWQTALVYLAHLQKLNTLMTPTMGLNALLPLWQNLPTQGLTEDTLPLYQQLFMTPGVLNGDWAFDDPAGQFPWNSTDTLAQHQGTVQGVLSLSSDDITVILTDAGLVPATAGFNLANLSLCYRTSLLAQCLQLSVTDLIAFKALTGLNPFLAIPSATLVHAADDLLQTQTLAFVQQVLAVQNSGFTITDLQYLLRQNIAPASSYVPDPNAIMTLLQTLMTGFQQIQTQNAVPANLSSLPDSQVDQLLSKLFPAALPKSLLTLLGNAQSFSASLGGVAVAIDPTPFAAETRLSFSYDAATQTQTIQYQGLLTDGKKTQLQAINNTVVFAGLLTSIQQQLDGMLAQRVADILAVWASLTQYQAVKTPVLAALPVAPLQAVDPAISLAYDQSTQLQWISYRGVLTKTARTALEAVNNSADLSTLLNAISQQTLADYSSLFGTILAMLTNVQSFDASQTGVLPANALNSTLFAAWPALQLSYDAASKTQYLHYQGVLSAGDSAAIAAVAPTSASLPVLLASVRDQAVQLFQHLAGNDLTVTAVDLDTFSAPLQNLTATAMQKQVKAELISVFLPLQAQKLTRQLVLQTLSSDLSADASLTEALVTDVALLTDPSNPGTALLGTFLNAAQTGVTASWYASNNLTGPVLKQTTASSVDSTDVSNPGGAASARFEAYLQLPSDGVVQLFAELGNTNAQLMLHLDAPDPTALFVNPILLYTASKNGDEARQFVHLKGGIAYHFIVEIQNIGAQGVSLLIQGENLPKGALSRALLYPRQNVIAFTRAQLLLSKVIQIFQTTGLGVREISYLLANANQFGNIHLAALPTQTSDDTLAKAQALFKWFAVLLDYADLRANAAGHTDGLINVIDNVGISYTESTASSDSNLNPDTPWAALASVTRRDVATVRSLARYFGFLKEIVNGATRSVTAQGDFANNRGLRRMWQAMQIQNIIGVPVETLTSATNIVSLTPPPSAPTPDVIANQFKNALMARYTNTAWLPIAQSIFDKLRQKKRDALVAYLINQLSLDSENQLFEYFLIDPGMEPVVQTSRLRLALSSVQTFIQRCFLDLENANNTQPRRNVAPNALDADWWAWMKRYRVWEANREIFLFPENWMEPELRLDKTDLFQTLESTLLQDDVTSDLADSAFLTYLQGLDVVARLDIVATYLDQNLTHPDISTLHVLGRTYGSPHKYYYRTYSAGTWSMWQAVKPDIDGNHIVLAMWRGRLNIFWLTFATVGLPPTQSSVGGDSTNLNNLSLGSLLDGVFSATSTPQLQVQLNWVEYVVHNGKGKWSDRLSSNINQYNPENPFDIWDQFDVDQDIYVHVSVEVDSQGNEGAVLVHLDIGPYYEADDGSGYAFRITSKNSIPDFGSKYWQPLYNMPYNADNVDATQYIGSSNLKVGYQSESDDSGGTWKNDTILSSVNDFSVLNCANITVPPYMDKSNPFYYQAGALIAPFFYKDRNNGVAGQELTFFVQPSLTETTTVTWNGWAYAPASPGVSWLNSGLIDNINISAQVPSYMPVNPGDPADGLYILKPNPDWVTNPATVVSYGGVLIGTDGAVHASISGSGVINAVAGPAASLATGLTASKQIDLLGMAINMSRG